MSSLAWEVWKFRHTYSRPSSYLQLSFVVPTVVLRRTYSRPSSYLQSSFIILTVVLRRTYSHPCCKSNISLCTSWVLMCEQCVSNMWALRAYFIILSWVLYPCARLFTGFLFFRSGYIMCNLQWLWSYVVTTSCCIAVNILVVLPYPYWSTKSCYIVTLIKCTFYINWNVQQRQKHQLQFSIYFPI